MPTTVLTRRRLLSGGVGLTTGSAVVLTGGVLAGGGLASAHGTTRLSADDVLAINNLKAGYAYGSDALAAWDVEEGRARCHAVFTDDAHVTSPPIIDATGPDELVTQVLAAVGGARLTQHLLGTIEIVPLDRDDRYRDRAAVSAYVQATVVPDAGGVQRVLASYADVAVRTRRGWRLASSAATTIHFESVPPA
jgi:hypothetical protein